MNKFTMRPFIHEDFLLESDPARELFHTFAEPQPIFDYHCHLSPKLIADNHRFADLHEIWLAGDHYKWRALRANGVPERFITGGASPREKFDAWCATVPKTLRNPLYHWSHLELKRTFGIETLIGPDSADVIWQTANAQLENLTVHELLRRNRVNVVCTTDDPADSLEHHERIRSSNLGTKVFPTFRPDGAFAIDDTGRLRAWASRLAGTANTSIRDFDGFLAALKTRHDAFHVFGCRVSDHGLLTTFSEDCDEPTAAKIWTRAFEGETPTPSDVARCSSYLLKILGRWDAARGWTKQLHVGARRNVNTRLCRQLGADSGFDTIADAAQVESLVRYLDSLDQTDELPRTIVYNLNPADNYAFATAIGCFQGGGVTGKIQFGSGWWFLDQKEAIEWQLNALSNCGLLSRFVGMLTDSRSFMSFTRHEYFRRVLCNTLGGDMSRGELPDELALIGELVSDICYSNARDYFRMPGTADSDF